MNQLFSLLLLFGVIIHQHALSQLCPDGEVDLLIVGAGMSGLSAANHLKNRAPELTFKVIESTEIVGGRVRTVEFGGQQVEFGAGWALVERFGRNSVPDLLEKYGIATVPQDFYDFSIFSRQGSTLTEVASSAIDTVVSSLEGAANCLFEYIDEFLYNEDGTDDPEDVGFVAGLGDGTLRLPTCTAVWQGSTPLENFMEWVLVDYEYAESDTSFYSLPIGEGSIPLVTGGYGNLPQSFAEEIFETSQLMDEIDFQTKVTAIDYEYTDAPGYSVRTTVANEGSSCDHYLSNYVVLTVSMGVLQQGGITFSPPLSRQPSESPYSFPVYQRLYFKFNETLGAPYNREFLGTYDEDDYNERCHHWQNLGAPGIDKGSIWQCTLLDEVMEELAAENPEDGGATLSDDQIDQLLDRLRIVFPENAAAMTQGAYEFFLPDIMKEEAFGFGSYENWMLGATELDDFYPFFGGGLFDQYCQHNGCDSDGNWRLHLSGSASCWEYYGLVDGAYYAGERTIEYILYDMGMTPDYDDALLGRCDDIDYLQAVFDQRNADDGDGKCEVFFLFWPFCILWKLLLSIWNLLF